MKRLIPFWMALLPLSGAAWAAAGAGSLGLGLQVGTLTGVNAKFWMGKETALQGAVGSAGPNGIVAEGAFLWHRYGLFHSDRDDLENNLPLYFGVGGLFANSPAPWGTGSSLASAMGVMGISYLFTPEPFDLFMELKPTVYFSPSSAFEFNAGMGVRYYFGAQGKAEAKAEDKAEDKDKAGEKK